MDKICCIYLIKNVINNNFYLGSTHDFNTRKKTHLNSLIKNKHHSKYLQNAVNKYSIENYNFEIYQFCHPNERLDLENYYILNYKPKYNMSKKAGAPMFGRKHTKETIIKLKNRVHKFGKDHHCYGKKLTNEHKMKMQLSKIGKKRNQKTKNKMSSTAKKINSISRINRDNTRLKIVDDLGNLYNSLVEAATSNNCSTQAVCDNLKGRSFGLRNGRQFKYFNEEKIFDRNIIEIRGKGERFSFCKLSNEIVRNILIDIFINKLKPFEIKSKYNINKSRYDSIRARKSWKHVQF